MLTLMDISLLAFLLITAFAILKTRNLLLVVILGGIFSFLMASLFLVMDAVDVALTETAIGAGVSTMLFLAALRLVGTREKVHSHSPVLPIMVVVVCAVLLFWGVSDLPNFGDPNGVIHTHLVPRFLEDSVKEVGPIPNFVTSILASYRGYDTLGEVLVIFAAGAGVMAIVGGKRDRSTETEPKYVDHEQMRAETEAENKAKGQTDKGAEA